jgi:hypothetical protein
VAPVLPCRSVHPVTRDFHLQAEGATAGGKGLPRQAREVLLSAMTTTDHRAPVGIPVSGRPVGMGVVSSNRTVEGVEGVVTSAVEVLAATGSVEAGLAICPPLRSTEWE